MVEVDEAELLYFHDISYCPDCDVLICHSCSTEKCSLLFVEEFYEEFDLEERVL